jgi:hypothetical protein
MLATTVLEGSRSTKSVPVGQAVFAFAVLSISGLAAVSAFFLLERRLAGALTQPLHAGLLVGIAAIALVVATATRLMNRSVPATCRDIARWIITASLPLLAVALSLPLSPAIGLIILWLSIVGAEVQLWRRGGGTALRWPPRTQSAAAGHSMSNEAAVEQSSRPSTLLDPGAAQQLIYRQADDRTATVEGWLRAQFAPGERTINAHVAFCPAFSSPPQVDVELTGGPECSIRPTLVLPWGARFELKLAEPAVTPSSVTLEFLARERDQSAAQPATETVS